MWTSLIVWKRLNLLALIALVVWGSTALYTELQPLYIAEGTKVMILLSYMYLFFCLMFLALVWAISYLFKPRKLSMRKIVGFALLTPLISLSFLPFGFSNIGFTLMIILGLSIVLQLVNWKIVNEWMIDVRDSFSPHLKEGYHAFLECRSSRNSNTKSEDCSADIKVSG